ncbi:hypothetical protein [Archangium lansingense]|uniref:Uncharacterized protein n=1 Tax=Archangium lansingense TaxID=2995310 RepID=A0ABT4A5I2_9BACT|nr:hypothetical protein [Archangium lansinium]MCY1076906.1 hypothetical protein [Archangium lansinium]
MQIHDLLNEGLLMIGSLQRAAESAGREEEVTAWRHVRAHWNFTIITGQVYVFEDYLAGLDPKRTSYESTAFKAHTDELSKQGMALLLRALDETTDPARKQHVLVMIDLLNFIVDSGKQKALESYREGISYNPLYAIAYFDTRAEAEAWLNSPSEPPSGGHVLIGDEYYELWYSREDGFRELLRDHSRALLFEVFESKPLPPATASFDTREEAMAWLTSHPASPMLLVAIAGEYHHAVYHKHLNRHTLHSLSRLREEREKLKAEQQQQQEDEEAESSED